MRVLLLTTDAYGGHGGIALYNRDLVEALVTMPEMEEVVVIPRNMPLPPEAIPAKATFMQQALGGKRHFVRTATRAARQPFDLVICGHINLLPLAVLLNLYIRAPLVLMAYGIDVWTARYRLEKQWLAAVDAVWSISAITRDRMNAWAKLPESMYSILPNAVHLSRYGLAAQRQDLLQKHGLAGSKVIMTLGRLPGAERYKGVDEVMDVLPALLKIEPRLKYLVAGDGDDRPRLKAKAKTLGLADKVVFTGMIAEADKADYFRLADVFAMPGRGEGFGFVFLEALACGVPAVGSRLDGSREALLDGELGELADPDDPDSIKQGVLNALAKPKTVPAGLSYFAWPAFVERIARAVHQVTQSGQTAGGRARLKA